MIRVSTRRRKAFDSLRDIGWGVWGDRPRKVTVADLRRMKGEDRHGDGLYPSALLADRAGVDAILVGDS